VPTGTLSQTETLVEECTMGADTRTTRDSTTRHSERGQYPGTGGQADGGGARSDCGAEAESQSTSLCQKVVGKRSHSTASTLHALEKNRARTCRRAGLEPLELQLQAREASKEYHDAIRKQKKAHWDEFLADDINIWQADDHRSFMLTKVMRLILRVGSDSYIFSDICGG
jgi:hypothetical protein